MKVVPIPDPLPGERIIDVYPALKPELEFDARRRLNCFTGRSISDVGFTAEQAGRQSRIAASAQAISSGVLHGLEVTLEAERNEGLDSDASSSVTNHFLHVAAGIGLTAWGEDVFVPRNLRVKVGSVPVFVKRDGQPFVPASTLDQALGDGDIAPPVGILVLVPAASELRGEFDRLDQCEEDPNNYAFEDWQLVDGCRLVYLAWPADTVPLPQLVGSAERWRNELAYAIFQLEQSQGPQHLMPWQQLGVPIAMIGFRGSSPLFVDRHSVVRPAGKANRRHAPAWGQTNPALWQARIQQFAEQLVDADRSGVTTKELGGRFRYLPPAGILPGDAISIPHRTINLWLNGEPTGGHFTLTMNDETTGSIDARASAKVVQSALRALPGATSDGVRAAGGPLDRAAITISFSGPVDRVLKITPDSSNLEGGFSPQVKARSIEPHRPNAQVMILPETYAIEMTPAPIEQLDLLARKCGPLAPLDTAIADRVRVFVPVPESVYEPGLLDVEVVAQEFYDTLTSFIEQRAEWLSRRTIVRRIAVAIISAIKDQPLTFPSPDPNVLDNNEQVAASIDPAEDEFGTELSNGDLRVTSIVALRARLQSNTHLKSETSVSFDPSPPAGFPPPAELGEKIRLEATNKLLVFTGAMSETERDALVQLDPADGAFATAIRQLFDESQNDDLSKFDDAGLEGFVTHLQAKVNAADDVVDLSFARTQTDIYRVRQLMLGTDAASRLATSPILAEIAKGDTAVAARADVNRFVQAIQKVRDERPKVTTPPETPVADKRTSPTTPRFTRLTPPSPSVNNLFLSGDFSLAQPVIPVSVVPFKIVTPTIKVTAATIGRFLKPIQISPIDKIIGQQFIVGKTDLIRTITVGERLQTPPALEAKNAAAANMYEAVKSVARLGVNVDDILVTGLARDTAEAKVKFSPEVPKTDDTVVQRVLRERSATIGQLKANNFEVGRLILADPDSINGDEADFFTSALDLLEHTAALLRRVEARIHGYKQAIAECGTTLDELNELAVQVDRRLKVIEDELAEARHDVSVTRSLLAEEESRVDAINERRDGVLATQVELFAYCRTRSSEFTKSTPLRALDPGLVEASVPTCLARDVEVPTDLREMVDLFRQAPIKWFPRIAVEMEKLDRADALQQTVVAAKTRAQAFATDFSRTKRSTRKRHGRLGMALSNIFAVQREVLARRRLVASQLDLAVLRGLSWKETRDQAAEVTSLGDLLDADHGRSALDKSVTDLLDQTAQIANCAYSLFGEVTPSIRLDWAERLSQFDNAVNLRNLATLPKWGDIEYRDRRQLQELVDWLYDQVDVNESEATELISDLVRVCILLASHAPVSQIIAGHVDEPTTVNEGGEVQVKVDPAKVRIGMPVAIYVADRVVARGIIEDLLADRATTRIVHAFEPAVRLDRGARVHFGGQTLTFPAPRRTSKFGLRSRVNR